jgi:hypothetical protein
MMERSELLAPSQSSSASKCELPTMAEVMPPASTAGPDKPPSLALRTLILGLAYGVVLQKAEVYLSKVWLPLLCRHGRSFWGRAGVGVLRTANTPGRWVGPLSELTSSPGPCGGWFGCLRERLSTEALPLGFANYEFAIPAGDNMTSPNLRGR